MKYQSFLWKDSLEKLLKSLELKLVVHEFIKYGLSHEAYSVLALDSDDVEARVTSEDEYRALSDGSEIWYPFYDAYGTSEENACKLWLEAATGNKLCFFKNDKDADDVTKCSRVILVPKLDMSNIDVLRMQLDILGG